MPEETEFDLRNFLPYLLNQAAEECILAFQTHYKSRYGMLRTEWRVLFHLGRYGDMTATEIGLRAWMHKTRISRAVAALERRRFLNRQEWEHDRRHAQLKLTVAGRTAYNEMREIARAYNQSLVAQFSENDRAVLQRCLLALAHS